ncbi:MAG: MCE family protein [Bacteroidetes bacterium]|nr:MCE family protein [Bacteroidota bacterium]MBT4729053.1 MCE family protein [Bacteroidota bacterium]MBT5528097.1 MCE family protein [Cytophagia bacterium]
MKVSDETKVGIFAVFALAILFFGFSFMKGKDVFSSNFTYYALYDDILGLQVSNPIVLNGHRIGKVYDIRLQKENENRVLIVLSIKGGLDLPIGTKARIVDLDILGQKAVELVLGESNQYHESKDTIIGETSSGLIGEMLAPYIEKLNESIEEIKQSWGDTNAIDIKGSMSNLTLAIADIKQVTGELKASNLAGRLSNILAHVESITKSLKENEDNINAILANLNSVSDSLSAANIKGTIDESYAVLKQIDDISTKINQGEGSLGLLVNDNQLYDNLKKTSENLDKLIVDLKEHPEKYVQVSVFGGKSKSKKE